jgi:hypothetical protein
MGDSHASGKTMSQGTASLTESNSSVKTIIANHAKAPGEKYDVKGAGVAFILTLMRLCLGLLGRHYDIHSLCVIAGIRLLS